MPNDTAATEATHTLWDQPVRRAPEADTTSGDSQAWRFVIPCDETCHHPVHAFSKPRGAQHLEWFKPGTAPVVPLPNAPERL